MFISTPGLHACPVMAGASHTLPFADDAPSPGGLEYATTDCDLSGPTQRLPRLQLGHHGGERAYDGVRHLEPPERVSAAIETLESWR